MTISFISLNRMTPSGHSGRQDGAYPHTSFEVNQLQTTQILTLLCLVQVRAVWSRQSLSIDRIGATLPSLHVGIKVQYMSSLSLKIERCLVPGITNLWQHHPHCTKEGMLVATSASIALVTETEQVFGLHAHIHIQVSHIINNFVLHSTTMGRRVNTSSVDAGSEESTAWI